MAEELDVMQTVGVAEDGERTLDKLIEVYFTLLPEIRAEHGSAWALLARGELIAAFDDFSDAAEYAQQHFPAERVLIRHTSERPLQIPMIENPLAVAELEEAMALLRPFADFYEQRKAWGTHRCLAMSMTGRTTIFRRAAAFMRRQQETR